MCFNLLASHFVGFRPGATGGHTGAVPPQMTACTSQTKIVPPKRGLCPEEIYRLGATGVQIEAQIGVFLWTDTGFHDVFRMNNFFFFFFLRSPAFGRKKPLKFSILAGKSLAILVKTFFFFFFFFGDHLFSAG